jgi:predicted metalloprotease with PDZ domain
MWPYDYSRENESPLLWVSEGFTNYYGVVATYRAGITSQEAFLQRAADAASGIENSEARHYISPAEASVSTWVGYDTPVAFGISYYTQGQNLGALLDLSIRNDTDGRRSLDDVMRTLYSDFYRRGRGFTTEDMIQAINRLTRKDYHEFYRRYVFGTDVPNYGQIFGYAGYSVEEKSDQVPEFGFFSRFRSGGLAINGVEPNSPASVAGLRRGDVITKINGQQISGFPFNTLAGKTVTLTVERDGTQTTVPMTVGSRTVKGFKLVDIGRLSDRQRRVRESWLKR